MLAKVVQLHEYEETKKRKLRGWQGQDDVFMHTSQVFVGAELRYYGRTDHNSVWRVVSIRTLTANTSRNVKVVQRLKDTVVLSRVGDANDHKCLTFIYLSYSAIWRINKRGK